MEEVGSGYTIFWKGREEGESRLHGVGFAIKPTLVRMHQLTPTAISERLMALCLPRPQNNFITVLFACAPTLDADEDVKNQFYDRLSATIYSVPSRDITSATRRLQRPIGKISSAKKAWETATKTNSFCSASAPNMHSPSRIRCSACQIVSKQHGDIRAQSTGTCWTTPSSANLTGKTSLSPEQSLVQTTAGQTTVY